jgi:signal transduction histidine kinase
MAEQVGSELGAEVIVSVPRRRFAGRLEELVYRTVQEAMANVRKHSEASRVAVTVEHRRDTLAGVVADDGRGFAMEEVVQRSDRVLHMGLATMVERVRLAGGAVDIDSEPGAGTRVSFDVPIGNGAGPPGA